MSQTIVPCTIMRGGTSKGLYLLEQDLPPPGKARDRFLLRLMGSPDAKQIDGLGGAVSVTSKAAILAPSDRTDSDVDYLFAQISVDKPLVSYAGNCGNISAGVGPFAIESGLVKAGSSTTCVRIFNRNTGKIILETVQTPHGIVAYDGGCSISGVPGTAAPVKMTFADPAGSVFGALLPTGNAVDKLNVDELGLLEISIVDATNPLIFVRASDVGMSGRELPAEIDSNPDLLRLLEKIRGEAAKLLDLVSDAGESAWKSPSIPKMTIVAAPRRYTTTLGTQIEADEIGILGRMMSMQKAHPTYAMTGAMCTAAAAVIPGSIVSRTIRQGSEKTKLLIGHPGGVLETGVDYTENPDGGVQIRSVYGYRTARKLMTGSAFINHWEEE